MVTKVVNPVLNLLSPAVDGALFGADVNMGGNTIENLPLIPSANDHAASKFYVDQVASAAGGGVFLPAGFGPIPWSGTAVPVGWLICDGTDYDPVVYPDLFGAIGFTYNTGGETPGWFRVPDMRGIVPGGMDDMTPLGSAAGPGGNVTAGAADILGGIFGSEDHVLTLGQMPNHDHGGGSFASSGHTHTHSHTHSIGSHTHPVSGSAAASGSTTTCEFNGGGVIVSNGGHTHTISGTASASTGNTGGASPSSTGGPSASSSISPEGSSQAHNNVQPTRFFGYIIKHSDSTLAFPGDIIMGGNRITGMADPISPQDAATMAYVDAQVTASSTYDVALFVGGLITSVGKEVARFPAVRAFTIQSGYGNSQASARVGTTSATTFTIRRNGGFIGSISFSGGGDVTGSFSGSGASFSVGDILTIIANNADATLEDIGITIEATI